MSEPPGLLVRPREGATERCPYCHDCLEGGEIEDARVMCEGCGTSHHRACLAELGGCTVMGCPGGKTRPIGGVEAVQARIRERIGRFVVEHASRPPSVLRSRSVALVGAESEEREAKGEWARPAPSFEFDTSDWLILALLEALSMGGVLILVFLLSGGV